MAYHAQFHTRLLQQVNEMNTRNLELQSLLAQKDDQLTQVSARLHNALASGSTAAGRSSVSALQRQNAALRAELHRADGAATTAEANLQTITKKFAEIEADLRRQIQDLQGDVRKRDDLLREVAESSEPVYRPGPGYGRPAYGANPNESTTAQNELKRLRSAYASLQKQFKAEKKQNARLRNDPGACEGKMRHIEEDQDDEESVMQVKREDEGSMSTAPPMPTPRSQSMPDTTFTASPSAPAAVPCPLARPATPEDMIRVQHRPSQTIPMKRKSPSTSASPPSKRTSPSKSDSFLIKRESPSKSASPPVDDAQTSLKPSLSWSRSSRRRLSPDVSSSEEEDAEDDEEEEEEEDDDDDDDDEELDNDEDFGSDEAEPSAPSKRGRRGSLDFRELKEKFEFQAVTQHLDDGSIEAYSSHEDLRDECDELWEHIARCVERWEDATGEDWAYEFEKAAYRPTVPPCVATKLLSKRGSRMAWAPGCEGKYACKNCVRDGNPCFTWTGEEFWLLPLRDEDRQYPWKEGLEIRYWLNVE